MHSARTDIEVRIQRMGLSDRYCTWQSGKCDTSHAMALGSLLFGIWLPYGRHSAATDVWEQTECSPDRKAGNFHGRFLQNCGRPLQARDLLPLKGHGSAYLNCFGMQGCLASTCSSACDLQHHLQTATSSADCNIICRDLL